MAINIGSNSSSEVYVGSTQISEVYKGGDKVFPDVVYEYELIVQNLQPEAIGGQYQLQITSQKKGMIDGQVIETIPVPYSISGGDSWVSIQDNQLTIQENQSLQSRECNVMITQTETGGKSTEAIITQKAGSYTYSTPSVQLSYNTVPASGGTAHPSISYSQTYGWNGRESGVGTLTSGGQIEYSVGNNGNVDVPSKGTAESGITTVQAVTATVTLNGKQGQAQANIRQAANTASYGEVSLSVQSPIECDVTGGEYRINPIYSQTVSFTSGSTRAGSVSVSYAEQSPMEGFSLSGNIVTVTENQSSASREGYTVTVTATGEGNKSATDEVVFNQVVGARSYADPVITSFTYPEIPASGGQATPTVTYEQTWGWNGQTTGGGTITSGAALSFSGTSVDTSTGEVSAASKETTPSGETTVTEATVKVTLNNKQATATFQVKQAANTESYGDVAISGGDVAVIPASGGSVSQATGISSSQTVSYTSGASRSGSVSISYSAAVSASSKGTSVSGQTEAGTLTATATGEGGKSASKQFTVYQAANAATTITYGTPSVSLSVDDIPASGGSVSSGSVSYSQSRTQNYTSGATSALSNLTSGGSVQYSSAVSASSRGTTTGDRRSVGTLTATVSMNGKSGNGSATVYQEANTRSNAGISYGTWNVSVSASNYTSTSRECSAGGGSCTISRSASRSRTQKYSYTSGATSTSSLSSQTATPTLSVSGSGASLSGTSFSWASRGTSTGSRRSATVTATYSGHTDTVTLYQEANEQTGSSISYGSWSVSCSASTTSIPASGGSATISASASRSRKRVYTYTSGSTSSSSMTNETATPTLSKSGSGSLSGSTVSFSSRGTTTGSALTCTVTASYGGRSDSVTITQAANSATTITYGTPTVNLSVSDIPASGGSISSGTVTYSQPRTQNYTSGASSSISALTSGGSISYSAAVSASSKGTTASGRTSVGTLTATVTMNGKSGKGSATVYQAANSAGAITYGTPTVTLKVNDIPASGGSISSGTVTYSQSRSQAYTSGASATLSALTTGGSVTYSAAVSAGSKGTTVSGRNSAGTLTATVTMNGKSGKASATVYQAANAATTITYGNITISSFTVADIPAGGGTVSSGTVSYSQPRTQNYTSGATAALSALTSGGSVSYSTGVHANNLGTAITSRLSKGTLTVTVSMNGKSASKSATVYQAKNKIENTTYKNMSQSGYSVNDIPASGGSVSAATINYNVDKQDNFSSGSTHTSIISGQVYENFAAVTGKNLGSTVKSRTLLASRTGTLHIAIQQGPVLPELNYSVNIYQEANEIKSKLISKVANVRANPASLHFDNPGAKSSYILADLTYQNTYTSGSVTTTTSTGSTAPITSVSLSPSSASTYFMVGFSNTNTVNVTATSMIIGTSAYATCNVSISGGIGSVGIQLTAY